MKSRNAILCTVACALCGCASVRLEVPRDDYRRPFYSLNSGRVHLHPQPRKGSRPPREIRLQFTREF
jgi:hypothetical protein